MSERKIRLLKYINALLSINAWGDFENIPISTNTNINDYLIVPQDFIEFRENKHTNLLFEAIGEYDSALDNDWFPETILDLNIPKAYLFLEEIKRIILEKEDEEIEVSFRSSYDKISQY